jgi:hypothetical protein
MLITKGNSLPAAEADVGKDFIPRNIYKQFLGELNQPLLD